MSARALSLLVGSVTLAAGGFLLPSLGAGCSSDATDRAAGAADAGDAEDATPDRLAPPPITRTASEQTLAAARESCTFKRGAWPAETIGRDYPVGADIPIDHVIVIMQENRSFDHYLGQLVPQKYYAAGDFRAADPDAGTPRGSGFDHADQLDVPPPGWSNLDAKGAVVVPHPDDEHCYGVNHSWAAMHDDYDDGRLDHFVTQNEPNGQRTFFYEDDTIIPFYYALASTFGVGDRYFASVLTSTWPNRFYLMAATSFGIGDNSFYAGDSYDHPAPHIFSMLEAGGHTWKDYTDGPHQLAFFPYFGFRAETRDHMGSVRCTLLEDIRNDTLPDVSFVMGDEVTGTSDEGPSALAGIGGALVETIIRTLFASPAWKRTAVFITYDEGGGLADHVPPVHACPPDEFTPYDEKDAALPGAGFDTTGFRVPFIVVSPYARAHFASHTVYDHTSITRFIEARFGLPALTARDANATPPMEMFDFANPPFLTPPTIAATTVVPPAILARCNQVMAPVTCAH